MREYGGGWLKSYSDLVLTSTGGGGLLMSFMGAGRDGVGAGVGVLLARDCDFRRFGLPPKGANIVAMCDILMPPEQIDFRGISGKQTSSELQIREGSSLSDRAGRSSPMQCNMYAKHESGTQPTPRALLTEATSCLSFVRASVCPAQIVKTLSKTCMGREDLLL